MNNTMNKVIRRNAVKQLDRIFGSIESIRVYSLDNHFSGETVEAENLTRCASSIREDVTGQMRARLTQRGEREYHVRIHSNLWFELTVKGA